MDHNRVNIRSTNMSCGVMELSGITDVEGALYQIAGRLYHPSRGDPVAFFVFSDVWGQETNSHALGRLIEKKGFGNITFSHLRENPKTGNAICVYVWAIDHEPFKKWYSEQRVGKIKKVGT